MSIAILIDGDRLLLMQKRLLDSHEFRNVCPCNIAIAAGKLFLKVVYPALCATGMTPKNAFLQVDGKRCRSILVPETPNHLLSFSRKVMPWKAGFEISRDLITREFHDATPA
jgi:hypothetical protein